MNPLILDLAPAYIPFIVQCTEGTGLSTDPTVDSLIIYEEAGADATFDSTTVTGSPFDPAKVNAKTGLWGVMVAKTAFTVGRWYIALWEMTVDGVTTAKVERYFACNASQFKATGFSTHSAADVKTAIEAGGSTLATVATDVAGLDGAAMRGTDNAALASVATEVRLAELDAANLPTDIDGVKAKTVNLPTDPADQSAVEAAITAAQSAIIVQVDANETKLDTVIGYLDTEIAAIQTALTTIQGYTDSLETSATTIAGYTDQVEGYTDTLEASLTTALADLVTVKNHLTDIKGATFAGATDSLEAIRDRGDAAWTSGGSVTVETGVTREVEVD